MKKQVEGSDGFYPAELVLKDGKILKDERMN